MEHGDDCHRHEHDSERVGLRDVELARPAGGSGRSRPGASGRSGREEDGGTELAERDCETRSRPRPRRPRETIGRSISRRTRPATRAGAPPPHAGAGRSSGASARRCARRRDRDEGLYDGDNPRGSAGSRAARRRTRIRKPSPSITADAPSGKSTSPSGAVSPRRAVTANAAVRRRRSRCVAAAVARSSSRSASRRDERTLVGSPRGPVGVGPCPPPTASDRSTRTASEKSQEEPSEPRLRATTELSPRAVRVDAGSRAQDAAGRSARVVARASLPRERRPPRTRAERATGRRQPAGRIARTAWL